MRRLHLPFPLRLSHSDLRTPHFPMPSYTPAPVGRRQTKNRLFYALCLLAAGFAIFVLAVLLASIFLRGLPHLNWHFLTAPPSEDPAEAGIWPALVGTVLALIIVSVTAIPIGVATAILLEEYRPKNPILRRLHGFVQMNITNLAGVPSIVYGILGVTVFASFFYLSNPPGSPLFTFGQTEYLEYPGLGGKFFYVRADRVTGAPPPSGDLTFYTAMGPDGETADVTLGRPEEFRDAAATVDDQLTSLAYAIEDAFYEQQGDGGRDAPIDFTPEEAQAAADTVTAEVKDELKTDLAPLRGDLAAMFTAMSGKPPTALEVRDLQNGFVGKVRAAEFENRGFGGVVLTDAVPQRRVTRPWYYLQFPFGRSVLAAGLTLMLVILPIVIVSAQEAVRSVPSSMRAGALALGGTKWQAIQQVVLPASIPGICTGAILALSRAIGEAAPVLLLAPTIIRGIPGNLMERAGMMPLQIFYWAQQPSPEVRQIASTGIIVLLAVLLTFNAVAVLIRQKLQRNY